MNMRSSAPKKTCPFFLDPHNKTLFKHRTLWKVAVADVKYNYLNTFKLF